MASEATAQAIVRQLDHVYVPLDDAKAAFAFLTEVLRLPEAWPYADYGFFGSGGVSLANVNLEALQGSDFPTGRPQRPARISGLAFEPAVDVDALTMALEGRGIAHTPPMPYTPEGSEDPFWTNVGFDVTDGTFFCKYHFDVATRRKQLKDELVARSGGLLGVVEVAEVVIGSRDLDRSNERWNRLLDPIPRGADQSWQVGGGPAIRLVTSSSDGVEHLVVRVRSVDRARNAARAVGIEVSESRGGLSIAPNELGGLVLELHQ